MNIQIYSTMMCTIKHILDLINSDKFICIFFTTFILLIVYNLLLFIIFIFIRWLSEFFTLRFIKKNNPKWACFCMQIYHNSTWLNNISPNWIKLNRITKTGVLEGIFKKPFLLNIFNHVKLILLFSVIMFPSYYARLLNINSDFKFHSYPENVNVIISILEKILSFIDDRSPLTILLAFISFLYLKQSKNRIKQAIKRKDQSSESDIIHYNQKLLKWIENNLWKLCHNLDSLLGANELEHLKNCLKGTDINSNKPFLYEIESEQLLEILNRLFNKNNEFITYRLFAKSAEVLELYIKLETMKSIDAIENGLLLRRKLKDMVENITNEEETKNKLIIKYFSLLELLYMMQLGYTKLAKTLYYSKNERLLNTLASYFTK